MDTPRKECGVDLFTCDRLNLRNPGRCPTNLFETDSFLPLIWVGDIWMSSLIKRGALAIVAFGLASSACSGAFAQATNCTSSPNTTGVANLDAVVGVNAALSA